MPFTPTHVLAIVPIALTSRGALPFSALAIGSMIPDFPLFVPWGPGYSTTHSIRGLVTACLPLGFGVFLIFQLLMKRPMQDLLPGAIRRRCASPSGRDFVRRPKEISLVSLAIVVGACTHVFWDSFTHQGRWGTRRFPGLEDTAMSIAGHPIPGFKLLQYGSTVLGLPFVVLFLVIWLRRQKPNSMEKYPALSTSSRRVAWLIIAVIPPITTVFVQLRMGGTLYQKLGWSISWTGLGLSIAAILYSVVHPKIVEKGSSMGVENSR